MAATQPCFINVGFVNNFIMLINTGLPLSQMITQIGSLPYASVERAVEYSLRHDIPFLPELTKLGDTMLEYIKNPGKMSCLDEFKKHSYESVKFQCVGPATLMQRGYDESDATSRIYSHVSAIIERLDAKDIVIFLDEPGLGHAGFDYVSVWEAIFSSLNRTIKKGVHTCGNMDWDILFRADIDIISFDASQFDITSYQRYADYRKNNGRIAWGISKPEDIRDFHAGDLITMPCGLGGMNMKTGKLYTEEECERALEMLVNARNKYAPF